MSCPPDLAPGGRTRRAVEAAPQAVSGVNGGGHVVERRGSRSQRSRAPPPGPPPAKPVMPSMVRHMRVDMVEWPTKEPALGPNHQVR